MMQRILSITFCVLMAGNHFAAGGRPPAPNGGDGHAAVRTDRAGLSWPEAPAGLRAAFERARYRAGSGAGGVTVSEAEDGGAPPAAAFVPLVEQQRLQASDAAVNDQFGYSVALSGDTAVVGARFDDHPGKTDAGSAYVFVRSGGVWTEQAKLQASDADAHDFFGHSVALEGDTAIVGAYADDTGKTDAGSAYVFTRSGTTWTQQQRLQARDADASDLFGVSVSMSGDMAIIGAYWDENSGIFAAGSAYVFTRSGGVWAEQQKLQAGDPSASDQFGWSVEVDGDTAMVGATQDDNGSMLSVGSVYVFTRSGGAWTQQQKLQASEPGYGDSFGVSISLSGGTAFIGAYDDDNSSANAGSAYVFARSGGVWTEQQRLQAGDAGPNRFFGWSVALEGDTAAVGALDNAYIFTLAGATWAEQQKLPATGDLVSVALDGRSLIAGAYRHTNSGGTWAGSAYVFSRPATDMEINSRDSADPVPVGGSFTYTLRVYNRGPREAHNVTVTDSIPSGLTASGVSLHGASDYTGAGCSVDPLANRVNCQLGTMRVFDNTFDGVVKKGKAVVMVTVTAEQPGQYTNEATVNASELDPDTSNNTGRQTTTALGISSVEVTPDAVPGGAACLKPSVKVMLSGATPYDTFVELSDDLAATANIPDSSSPLRLRVPAGQSSATVEVETLEVTSAQAGRVTAAYGTSGGAAPLTVRPIGVKSVSVSPSSVVGGGQSAVA
ncbi:MAG TPA: hypothetical protein VD968_18545, partial [Pyrinomonadaceae bacterium]|nr:hypothetical protein [Pyrinomonadaceae bacterium]